LSLEQFFQKDVWGSEVEQEVRRRIKLSVAAYAYEFEDESIMSDAEFDKMCLMVNKSLDTGNKVCDSYFAEQFDASTGQWIRKHPELDKIADLYVRFYKPTV
jgi:hypothetical protein